MSNGDLAGNNKSIFNGADRDCSEMVSGRRKASGNYEDWKFRRFGRVWDTDLFTGEVIDTENDWKEFRQTALLCKGISGNI